MQRHHRAGWNLATSRVVDDLTEETTFACCQGWRPGRLVAEGTGKLHSGPAVILGQRAAKSGHVAAAVADRLKPLLVGARRGSVQVAEIRHLPTIGHRLGTVAGALRTMALAALLTPHDLALVETGISNVQRIGEGHCVPDFLIAQTVLPGRHHAIHATFLGNLEPLLHRGWAGQGRISQRRCSVGQTGGAGTIAHASISMAGRAVFLKQGLAADRGGRLHRPLQCRRRRGAVRAENDHEGNYGDNCNGRENGPEGVRSTTSVKNAGKIAH